MDYRDVVCNLINKYGCKRIAEIGVWRGDLSKKIISKCNPDYLLLVDPFSVESNKVGEYQCTMGETIKNQQELDEMAEYIESLGVDFIRKPSLEAAQIVRDRSLDFVFIDAIHSYYCVVDDINAWLPKVRIGWILAGDDYIEPKHGENVRKAIADTIGKVENIDRVWWKEIK